MRGKKGKLICIWSPVMKGEGCSTLACVIGFGLHHLSGKRVLIVNLSDSISGAERFIEKDIRIKYSMDNLKIFNSGIRAEHIMTYATQINTDLYMIGGSRLGKGLSGEHKEFYSLFIESCREDFDLVIVDMDAGIKEEYRTVLDSTDSIISVTTPNEIVLDQLLENSRMKNALNYFTGGKTVNVINKLCTDWDTVSAVGRYKSRYSLRNAFGLNYDGDILNACCTDRNFYSFFMNRIKYRKSDFMEQLKDICSFIAGELSIEESQNEHVEHGNLLKRFRRISLY